MFCSKCGNEVNEGAVFCPKCGEKLINEKYQEKKDSTETEAITSFILGLVSVAFWVTIIIPILGIYFGNKGKNSAKATFAKIGKALSIFSLTVGAIVLFVLFGLPAITEGLAKNSSQVTAIPTYEESNEKYVGEYDWYSSLGIIQTTTCDENPATVRVDIALAYKKGDKSTATEITQRTVELKSFLRRFFNEKTVTELQNQNNKEQMKNEIINGINNKILSSSRLRDVNIKQIEIIMNEE